MNIIRKRNTNKGGIIRSALIFAVILIVLSYFGLNIRSIIASGTFQDNWHYISDLAIKIWDLYLRGIFMFLWDLIAKTATKQPQ